MNTMIKTYVIITVTCAGCVNVNIFNDFKHYTMFHELLHKHKLL